jgi:hypothetical protein
VTSLSSSAAALRPQGSSSSSSSASRALLSSAAGGANDAPFKILGLQQVALGALAKGDLSALWEGALSVPKRGEFVSEKENVDEDILVLGNGPMVRTFV